MGAILWVEPKDFTFQSEATAAGAGTVADLGGKYSSLLVQVTGTFSGTVTFQASQDGTNYFDIQGTNKTSGTAATTATAAGLYEFKVNGVKRFRANVTAYTSGSITAVGTATAMAL